MRILEIRLKNLNSLAGDWVIDLEDPALTGNGVFAITGPTGAGKSTLFDAICLALYARTPRLNSLSKERNDIMTRHHGTCLAEVVFRTASGTFRAHWSQHRAREAAGGKLQQGRHELSNALTGEVLESRSARTLMRIVAETGMEYEAFTRSMLLAQGSFAAFLQAKADERGGLLEQITGTGLYSELSRRAFERNKVEVEKLRQLEQQAGGKTPLDDSARQQLDQQLAACRQQVGQLEQEQTWLEAARSWQQRWQDNRQQQQETAQSVDEATASQAALAGVRESLQQAGRARGLAVALSQLDGLAERLGSNRRQGEALQQQQPAAQEALSVADGELQAAAPELARLTAHLTDRAGLWQQVEELDSEYRKGEAALARLQQLGSGRQQELREILSALAEIAAGHEANSKELASLRAWQQEHAADQVLAGQAGELCTLLDQAREAGDDVAARQQQLEEARRRQTEAEEQVAVLRPALAAAGEALDAARRQQDVPGRQLRELFSTWPALRTAGKGTEEPGEVWTEKEDCTEAAVRQRQEQLGTLGQLLGRLLETVGDELPVQEKVSALAAGIARQEQQVQALQRLHEACCQEVSLREAAARLAQQVASLTEQRAALQDGQPCPLCGATSHPWGEQAPDVQPVAPEGELAEARRRESRERDRLDCARQQLATSQGQHQAALQELESCRQKQKEADREPGEIFAIPPAIRKALAGWRQGTLAPALLCDILRPYLEDCRQDWRLLQEVLKRAADLTQELHQAAAAVDQGRQGQDTARENLATAEAALAAAAEGLQLRRQAVQEASARLARLEEEGQRLLSSPALVACGLVWSLEAGGQPLQDEIRRRQQAVVQAGEKIRQLEQEQDSLQHRQELRQQQQQQVTGRLAEDRQEEERLTTGMGELLARRRALFGDRKVEEDRQQCAAAVEAARQRHEAALQQQQQAARRLDNLRTQLETLQGQGRELEQEQQAGQQQLQQQAAGQGFASLEALRAALPAEEVYQHWQTQVEEAARQLARALDRQQDLRRQQEALSGQVAQLPLPAGLPPVDSLEPQVLLDRLQDVKKTREEGLASSGALQRRQEEDDDIRRQRASLEQEILRQQQQAEPWQQLNVLIGSSDGKKFRNFVQGLTLDRMLALANRQLAQMSDRYLLVRGQATSPPAAAAEAGSPESAVRDSAALEGGTLELDVIDTWQGDERRSSRNLSGGESFLVSLALALGLSRMSSRTVQVDSLFLDEGFGTLDEETLSLALATLTSLQQDGKVIGVISHVPALKERISAHIRLEPAGNGLSRLSGPGCRRGERAGEEDPAGRGTAGGKTAGSRQTGRQKAGGQKAGGRGRDGKGQNSGGQNSGGQEAGKQERGLE